MVKNTILFSEKNDALIKDFMEKNHFKNKADTINMIISQYFAESEFREYILKLLKENLK